MYGSAASIEKIDDSRAWLLVAAPILFTVVDAGLLFSGQSNTATIGLVVAFLANTIVCGWDSNYLKGRGYKLNFVLGVFLVPFYLARRSKVLGRSQMVLVVWIMAAVVGVVGDIALNHHFVQLNMPLVESSIESSLADQGISDATVSCPSRSVYSVGSEFLCDISSSEGNATARVHIANSSGDITWQVLAAG